MGLLRDLKKLILNNNTGLGGAWPTHMNGYAPSPRHQQCSERRIRTQRLTRHCVQCAMYRLNRLELLALHGCSFSGPLPQPASPSLAYMYLESTLHRFVFLVCRISVVCICMHLRNCVCVCVCMLFARKFVSYHRRFDCMHHHRFIIRQRLHGKHARLVCELHCLAISWLNEQFVQWCFGALLQL